METIQRGVSSPSQTTTQTTTSQTLGLAGLLNYMSQPLGVAFIVAGSATALGVFLASYVASPTWGSSSADWPNLFAAMFGAFVASATAFTFAKSLGDNRS
jgi:hypothetical protein